MKPESFLHADLLDIIFENRNKDYGAYLLRKQYPHALRMALTLVMASVVVTSVWFFVSGKGGHRSDTAGTTIIDTIDPVIILPLLVADKLLPLATIEDVIPVIDVNGTDRIPTIEALEQPVQIGAETRTGDTSSLTGPVSTATDSASGPLNEAPAIEIESKIYRSVQEMPEFPGGNAAMQRFLLKHLRVPDEGLEPGSRVTVEVQFVVNENGNITGMQVLRSGGEMFNKEVLRVLNKMPAWKPGRQNGMQVPVYFMLPVTFRVE